MKEAIIVVTIFVLIFVLVLVGSKQKPDLNKIIQTLTRQCSRWLIAAQQDESPMIAVLHVQYGMGYLWALKDVASAAQFNSATGLNLAKFESHAVAIQDAIARRVVAACPQYAGDIDMYLAKIAGEGYHNIHSNSWEEEYDEEKHEDNEAYDVSGVNSWASEAEAFNPIPIIDQEKRYGKARDEGYPGVTDVTLPKGGGAIEGCTKCVE
jgi:hypothetical protein